MAKYKMTKSSKVGKVGKKKTGKRKSRKVGAIGDWMPVLEFGAGVGLGVIIGRETASLIGSIIPTQTADPLMTGVVQAAGGLFLAKEVKMPFVKGIGYGVCGNGITTAVVSTGIISGPNPPMAYRLNGVKKPVGGLKFVAGPGNRIGTNGNSNLAMVAGKGLVQ